MKLKELLDKLTSLQTDVNKDWYVKVGTEIEWLEISDVFVTDEDEIEINVSNK